LFGDLTYRNINLQTWSHLRAYKQLNLEGLFSKDEQEQAALLSVQVGASVLLAAYWICPGKKVNRQCNH
jgi:hypothetical protein